MNKFKIILPTMVVCLIQAAFANDKPFTGGIALEKTASLVKQSIPLPTGNPEPLLALAMRHGQAQGHFSDKAAEAVAMRFGKPIPILVAAKRLERMKDSPHCHKVSLTFSTTPEFSSSAPTQVIETKVCAKRQ